MEEKKAKLKSLKTFLNCNYKFEDLYLIPNIYGEAFDKLALTVGVAIIYGITKIPFQKLPLPSFATIATGAKNIIFKQ